MAKKGQAVQLQIEVNTDEEWEKLLQKDGLIVVDVYSEWCGPCLGMQANLKKIKLEYGGDLLQLAIAKSDGITALERFRNKSEPTWMFISKGKMVALMFGADAPKLTRLILDELKKEQAQQEGQPTDRTPLEISEMAEEEKVRFNAAEAIQTQIREKEERKKAKELLERRTKECENIITNLPNYGTAIIFPSAKDIYKSVLNDILDEAGLMIAQTEKVHFDEEAINDLCYFTEVSHEFSEETLEELLNDESVVVLFKEASRAEIEDIDEAILTLFYGHTKHPPGDPECAAKKLIVEIEETEEQARKELIGAWVPPTAKVRATTLLMFFPKLSLEYSIPEPPPEPPHLAIIFPLEKKEEVLQVMQQFPNEIMRHGIFTSEDPDDTKLVSKTIRKLDKVEASQRTHSEKLVLQVSKKKSECILIFAQLEPLYMSPNSTQGKIECDKFFPEEYEPETEEPTQEELEEAMQEQMEGGTISESQDGDVISATEHPAEGDLPSTGEIEEGEGEGEGKVSAEGEEGEEGAPAAEGGSEIAPDEQVEGAEVVETPIPPLPETPSEEPVVEG